MEKIDILMATYNGENYVQKQIDSIINQTYSDFNLYILDDCSTDRTVEILKEYEKNDKRIKVFVNEKNLGSNMTFTNLLKLVKSKYFMFSDQDDVWYNTKVEDTYNKLKDENADLVFTDLEVVDGNLNLMYKSFNKKKKYLKKSIKYNDIRLVYLYNVITGCTILGNSNCIKKYLKMTVNNKILHDHKMGLAVATSGKIVYLNKPTLKYRQHGNNQVGLKRYTDKFDNFDDVRNHLINVKINLFKYYIDNQDIFNDKYKILNKEALEYFEIVKEKKYINFSRIGTFYKLYRYETFSYFMSNFFIMNLPFVVNILYNIRKLLRNGRSI